MTTLVIDVNCGLTAIFHVEAASYMLFQEVCPGEDAFQEIADPYERKQLLDVFMAKRLWEVWIEGKLVPPEPKLTLAV